MLHHAFVERVMPAQYLAFKKFPHCLIKEDMIRNAFKVEHNRRRNQRANKNIEFLSAGLQVVVLRLYLMMPTISLSGYWRAVTQLKISSSVLLQLFFIARLFLMASNLVILSSLVELHPLIQRAAWWKAIPGKRLFSTVKVAFGFGFTTLKKEILLKPSRWNGRFEWVKC